MAEETAAGKKGEGLCKIEASVPTGLEIGAAEECKEVLGRPAESSRGRLSFQLHSVDELTAVDNLKSIDNFWVVVEEFPDFCKDEGTVLERLAEHPTEPRLHQWDSALKVWRHYHSAILHHSHPPPPPPESSSPEQASPSDHTPLTFRVTCTRGGRKHSFTSTEAAGALGAGLVRRFGWKVQMKGAELEVLLNISGDVLTVSLALNKESKFKRNIAHFGPTTLRSTIAYGLLRMAFVKPGDIVLDPLCGGGSISIEGALNWSSTHHLAGDLHDLAPPRMRANLQALREERGAGLPVDVLQWDACRLPLRTASVDVVVTDMPFGKKSGSLQANWVLYPRVLRELARVCRPDSARAVLLTHDNKAFSKALQQSRWWKRVQTRWVNVGGLTAAAYCLLRNSSCFKE